MSSPKEELKKHINDSVPFLEEELTTSREDQRKCQMIYLNLIRMLDGKENITPTHIIRELWQTKRCDKNHNMSEVRARTESYVEKLSKGSLQKMFTIGQLRDEAVQDVADSTVIHYNSWYRDNLIDGLNIWNKAYYYFFYKTEVALASWSIVGGGAYGGKILFQKYDPAVNTWIRTTLNKK